MTEQVAEQAAAAGDAGEVPIKELSIEEAMRLAISMQQQGALDNAEEVYRRILSIEPGHAGAKHFLGLAVYHLNRKAEGIALVHESIALVPGEADWHSNLGNLLMEDWRLEEAHDCYKSAIRLNPGHANAVSNLGMVYRGLGMNEEAEQTFLRAIWLDSKQYAAFQNLGALYHKLGRVEEAIQCFLKAIIVKPKHNSHTRALLGRAYSATGQIDKAADVYRTWLAEEPDSPAARHMLAAVTEQDVPGRASDAYVTAEFDGFASSFDAKLEELEYKAPQFMAEALGAAAPGRMQTLSTPAAAPACAGRWSRHRQNH